MMKKIFMLLIVALLATVGADAKLKFKSFKATPNSCVVEMVDDKAGGTITSDGALLQNDGKEYEASWYGCELRDGKAVYKAVFPFQPALRNTVIILNINGKTVKKNITSDILDYLSTNPYLR